MAGPTLSQIVTNTQRTWQSDGSRSSTSSASRYDLDDEDTSPIVVYQWGASDIATSSQKELSQRIGSGMFTKPQAAFTIWISSADSTEIDPKCQRSRVTRMAIPRIASKIELKRCHLFLPEEKEEFRKYPNFDSPLAEIRLPSNVFWSRMMFNTYQELFIISPETSPEGSIKSTDSSTKISPSSTWSNEDASTGADKDE